MKYILSPVYGDMKAVVLGSGLNAIISKLKKHWVDVINDSEDCNEDYYNAVKSILETKYTDVDQLMEDYNEKIRLYEDYWFTEAD